MAVRSQSAKLFSGRAGLRATVPSPLPAYTPGANPAHALALAPPLPAPEFLAAAQGDPPPDRGRTAGWPHGPT